MPDPREKKSLIVGTLNASRTFTNFDSLLLIDYGAADGFNITDDSGNTAFIPTGVPLSVGKAGSSCAFLQVSAASGKSLQVSFILYQ
jgi:hypothetical protein